MAFGVGIVGMPNVGKSTLFNALTRTQQAEAANYPFCTIEPNKATVPVPDDRLDQVARVARPAKTVPATVEFVDIAGLVRGASTGEGLGNKFLAHIREASAILEVVRCFEDENVAHVEGRIDPLRDIDTVETELLLADIQTLDKRLERLGRMARTEKDLRREVEALETLRGHLDAGQPARAFVRGEADVLLPALQEMQLLTDKPVIYCANVGEGDLAAADGPLQAVRERAARGGADVVAIAARMEAELAEIPDAERREYLASYGLRESGLDQTVRTAYHTLGLASFFTTCPAEARAWTFRRGCPAQRCAGLIHTDFERGFIRAEVCSFADYIRLGGDAGCRAAGLLRVEGKEYAVQDGDVVHFLFHV